MSKDCYNNWNDQTRLKYDACTRHAYDVQSRGTGDYTTNAVGTRWDESPSEYTTNLCEPAHYQRVYRNANNVDSETRLKYGNLTNPRTINHLRTRTHLGAFKGAGQNSKNNKDVESELIHGFNTRGGLRRACDVLSGVSIDRFECLPEYGNPQRVQHIVAPWIRGGDNTRDHVRRINYEQRLKNSKNNKFINGQ